MAMTPAGRPSKLTPEVRDRICQLLKAGNTFRTACEVAGIAASTGREWRARGEDRHSAREGDEDFALFAAAVQKAEEEAAARNVALIQKAAAEGTWQAAAWWLERKFPAEWARIDRHEHTGRGGGPIQVQPVIDATQIKARIIEIARELGYDQPPAIGSGEVIEVEVEETEQD
jgi:hypothetical protein